jgi:uncharacterized phage-like protein YoqJ
MRTKFNETAKNWTDEKLRTHLSDRDYLTGYLSKYLSYKLGEYSNYYVQDFFIDIRKKFLIIYDDSNSGGNSYIVKTNKEYEELIEFLDNPDFFMDAKKYNI